jgi:hypothetical protein
MTLAFLKLKSDLQQEAWLWQLFNGIGFLFYLIFLNVYKKKKDL